MNHMPIYAIRRALTIVAQDVGADNRFDEGVKQTVDHCLMRMEHRFKFSPMAMRAVGEELDRLTEDELRTLCVGETNGMAAVERERKISVDTVRFLDSAFAIM